MPMAHPSALQWAAVLQPVPCLLKPETYQVPCLPTSTVPIINLKKLPAIKKAGKGTRSKNQEPCKTKKLLRVPKNREEVVIRKNVAPGRLVMREKRDRILLSANLTVFQ